MIDMLDLREGRSDEIPDVDPEILRPYQGARRLTEAVEIRQARRLHARVYRERGYITVDQVDPDGVLGADADPWSEHATYFAVSRGGSIVATARQIRTPQIHQLPTLTAADHDLPQTRAVLACAPGQVVEISALARAEGSDRHDAVALYSAMWDHSVRSGQRAWVMSVDLHLFRQLQRTICGDAIRPVGPRWKHMGGDLVTSAMFLDETSREQRRLARTRADRWPLCGLLPHLFTPWADSHVTVAGE